MKVKVQGQWIEFDNEDELTEQLEQFDEPYIFERFEDIPKNLCGEKKFDERVWDWAELDEREQDICASYWAEEDSGAEVSYIMDVYLGTYDDAEEYAKEIISNIGLFAGHPELESFFDYDAYADELRHGCAFVDSISERQVHVFTY